MTVAARRLTAKNRAGRPNMNHFRSIPGRHANTILCLAAALITCAPCRSDDEDPELRKFQGHWEVTDLVEDGKVIAKQKIRELLPSGGRAQIIENAIIFRSPTDGKQGAKVFRIEPAKYPKRIEVSTSQGKDSWGIYQFDADKLVICLTDPNEAARPGDFSAEAGSKRMRMVLKRSAARPLATKTPAVAGTQKPQPAQALKGLTDVDLTKMLAGTWRLNDNAGSLFVTFNANGTVSYCSGISGTQVVSQIVCPDTDLRRNLEHQKRSTDRSCEQVCRDRSRQSAVHIFHSFRLGHRLDLC